MICYTIKFLQHEKNDLKKKLEATWTQFYGFVNVIQSKIYKFEYKDNYNVWLRLKAAENKIPSQVKKKI